MIIAIAIATFFATLAGGMVALRFKDKLHLILGFSAGAVIGVAFFDLLPESIDLGSKYFDTGAVTAIAAAGFLAYLILDRWIFLHSHPHEDGGHHHGGAGEEGSPERGVLGAGSLSVHSFLDGVAIGLAFQISAAIGGVVAIAVLAHDFSDGVNTVNLILKNRGEKGFAFKWLVIDAAAPVLGAVSTMFFSLPEKALGVILAVFAGFFMYIGASDLIPESHHAHPKLLTAGMTILGAAVLFLAVHLANI